MKLTLDKEYYEATIQQLTTREAFNDPRLVCWLDISGNGTQWTPFIRKHGVYIDVGGVYTDITLKEFEENEKASE
jgi:hypothetical protein